MNYNVDYDETNPQSIERYAQKLIGKTFQDVCDEDILSLGYLMEQTTYNASHENKKRKGGLGEIIEERFFHYKANNDSRPDFYKAGVELKVTPYKINQNGSLSAKERLIITMIDYFTVINESFEDSHFWNKARLILIIYYLYEKSITNRLDYRIDFAKLFTPPDSDKRIMMHDFDIIVGKVKAGLAHELSGGDTLYLEAAPKAASSADRRKQPNSTELAKPRAFAFKNSYIVYFDARTKMHLSKYLNERKDDNEALFVSLKSPHNRLSIGAIEARLRGIGLNVGIDNVFPHKFRRTLATTAIDKGMPIEQLQRLLGHQRVDTTLMYAMVKQNNVKQAHKKYIS